MRFRITSYRSSGAGEVGEGQLPVHLTGLCVRRFVHSDWAFAGGNGPGRPSKGNAVTTRSP